MNVVVVPSPAVQGRTPRTVSLRRSYTRPIHGSTKFGNRNARSPSATTTIDRRAGAAAFSSSVNSTCRLASQNAALMDMNLHSASTLLWVSGDAVATGSSPSAATVALC